MVKVDELDKKILEMISCNARIPFKEVAEACGVSRAAVHQRVQHLVDAGVIVGSGFHVDPVCLGYNTCTYVGITLERGSLYKKVVEEFEKIPEIEHLFTSYRIDRRIGKDGCGGFCRINDRRIRRI